MMIDDLLDEMRKHYAARGVPSEAIGRLLSELPTGIESGCLVRIGELTLHAPVSVGKLIEELRKVRLDTSLGASRSKCDAIFCLSFGYRLKRRSIIALGEESRLPGENNRALAQIAARLKKKTEIPLYAQFEIADALDDYTDVEADYSSPPKDMGTDEAVKWFEQDARRKGKDFRTVFVVAHRHHMMRCLLLLRDKHGIVGVPATETYEGYDPFEKQDRVVSAEEFILNDAASTARHLATR